MKIKFGHRKKMIGEINKMNRFATFLKITDLESHKDELVQLGFKSMWSVLGVKREHAAKMNLTEEEMDRWLKQQEEEVGIVGLWDCETRRKFQNCRKSAKIALLMYFCACWDSIKKNGILFKKMEVLETLDSYCILIWRHKMNYP